MRGGRDRVSFSGEPCGPPNGLENNCRGQARARDKKEKRGMESCPHLSSFFPFTGR